ncbi:hypothetical protein ACF0H5_003370 [Mactra antiquata]
MGRPKSTGGTPKQEKSQQQKRARFSSGGVEEDPEVMIDTMLSALSEPDTMKRFISSLCAIPDMKTRLVEHLLPTLMTRKLAREYNVQNNTRHYISEDLTKNRSNSAFQARKLKREGAIRDTWTFDGKIFIKAHNDEITMGSSVSALPKPN